MTWIDWGNIPDAFYIAMAGELVSIFGTDIIQPTEDGGYDLQTSTAGWNAAFAATCDKLNMNELREFCRRRPYNQMDEINGEIEKGIIQIFLRKSHYEYANDYYKYITERLINKHEE